jgi:hypothetical protein
MRACTHEFTHARTLPCVHLEALRIALKLREGIALVYRRRLQEHVPLLHGSQETVHVAVACT